MCHFPPVLLHSLIITNFIFFFFFVISPPHNPSVCVHVWLCWAIRTPKSNCTRGVTRALYSHDVWHSLVWWLVSELISACFCHLHSEFGSALCGHIRVHVSIWSWPHCIYLASEGKNINLFLTLLQPVCVIATTKDTEVKSSVSYPFKCEDFYFTAVHFYIGLLTII